MNTITLTPAIIVAFIVIATLGSSDIDLQQIGETVAQACPDQIFSGNNSESDVMQIFHDETMETIVEINATIDLIPQWVNELPRDIKNMMCSKYSVRIQEVTHAELSAEQNARLLAFQQMVIYDKFLNSQEDDATSYSDSIAERLGDLRESIVNAAFTLLSTVTCEALQFYDSDNVTNTILHNEDSPTKRTVTYCALEDMLAFCQTRLLSFQTISG